MADRLKVNELKTELMIQETDDSIVKKRSNRDKFKTKNLSSVSLSQSIEIGRLEQEIEDWKQKVLTIDSALDQAKKKLFNFKK